MEAIWRLQHGSSHHSNTSIRWLVVTATLLALVGTSTAAPAPVDTPVSTGDVTVTATLSATSVDLSSALSVAASVAVQASQIANNVAIPVPANHTMSDYDTFTSLAAAMPPLQTFSSDAPSPEHIDAMLRDMMSSINSSEEPDIAARATPLRVMIVGDSISHGREGDWTWRYRIWQWFTANNIAVDFVGPYHGTLAQIPGAPPAPPLLYGQSTPMDTSNHDGKYNAGCDPNFDSDHFAYWGRAMSTDAGLIQGVLGQYPADMILLLLGFNDLGWYYVYDANGLIQVAASFINNARAANPNIKIAMANVVQRTFIGGRQDLVDKTNAYDQMLPTYIAQWSTPQSPIHLVSLREAYDCNTNGCNAGSDGLHPNALGEYQIAYAFSQTLYSSFGLGSGPLQIPTSIPARSVPVPSNFKVFTSPQGVTATWDPVFGAYGYIYQLSVSGATFLGGATTQTGTTIGARADTMWPFDGATYSFSVKAQSGDAANLQSGWTSTQGAVAHPQLAPPPANIKTSATATGLTVTWDNPTGAYTDSIVEYNIILWDLDTPCAYLSGAAFKSSPAHVDGLLPGHRYLIAPVTWNANGEGFPGAAHKVRVGSGKPGPPQGLAISTSDNSNIHLTWNTDPVAAGWTVWSRNTYNSSDYMKREIDVDQACFSDYVFYPASWFWQYCVTAWNGNDESDVTQACSLAPSPTATVAALTCPAPAPWCPNGAGAPAATDTNIPPAPTTTGSSAGATSAPAPGSYNSDNCSNPYVLAIGRGDPTVDFTTAWNMLDTPDAWNAGVNDWRQNGAHSAEFSLELASWCGDTDTSFKCESLTTATSCKQNVLCPSVKSPACWLILNSIAGVSNLFGAFYGAMDGAQVSATNSVLDITNTFGKVNTGAALLTLISSALNIAFVFTSLPIVGTVLSGAVGGALSASSITTIQTTAQSLTTGLLGAISSAATPDTTLTIADGLDQMVKKTISGWEAGITLYNNNLFNGTDQSLQQLYSLIENANVNGVTKSTIPQSTDLQRILLQAIYPQLIYAAWNLGGAPAFIYDAAQNCPSSGAPSAPQYVNSKDVSSTYVCVNGRVYFLLACKGVATSGTTVPIQNSFSQPQGLSTLSNGKYYMSVQQFVTGSVNTYLAAGSKNGAGMQSNTIPNALKTFLTDPTHFNTSAGILNIPVCGATEAHGNWYGQTVLTNQPKPPNYPCN